MSVPASPTFTNRNAIFASSLAMRRSEASAIQAPAPAVVPFKLAITGFGSSANIVNELARHASEFEQAFHVAAEQFTDDVVHVAARTERSTVPRDDNHANISFVTQRSKRIRQFAIDFKRQRIQTLRTIQSNRRDAMLILLVKKTIVGCFMPVSTAIPSISTFAASSRSPAT